MKIFVSSESIKVGRNQQLAKKKYIVTPIRVYKI